MKLAIIAGGKGTRLGLKEIPKPMALIDNRPILEHQILLAKKYNIKEIFIISGYLSDVIINYFGDGSKYKIKIHHIVEPKPLGTAGAIKLLENKINERFMVFYGDIIMDFAINLFQKFDQQADSIANIIVHPNDHPEDSDLVSINDKNIITNFHSNPHPKGIFYNNLVNAGVYIFSPDIFKYIPLELATDFGKDIFPLLLKNKQIIRTYNTTEYIKDMGTPFRFEKTKKDFISGKIHRLNKENKRKAIFLDRDGVINVELENLVKVEQFELLENVSSSIKKINFSEFLSIVITNQPVIAKGFCSVEELNNIHQKMETLLGQNQAYLDGIFYCPHHPEKGFEGEVEYLKINCNCRKPNTGMILDAVNSLNIEIAGSFFIGDRYSDIKAGNDTGLKTILLKIGHTGKDKSKYPQVEADYIFENLQQAIDFILRKEV